MTLSVNITTAMPPEMVERIDAARGDMSRARYIRQCIKLADGSPFETPDEELPDFSDMDAKTGGALA